jgi:predicted alpha/beta hydrolase family esterase
MSNSPTILIVPGLRDHVEEHWQTILERKLPKACSVTPIEHDKLSCAARVEALQQTIAKIEGPIILVAHSGGVMITVHWSQKYDRPIQGALFAAPADLESPLPAGYPTLDALRDNGWLPVPRTRLPFPSLIAASTNDPLACFERTVQYAKDWGSELVNIGAVGHLNPASGFGEWLQAETLIDRLR